MKLYIPVLDKNGKTVATVKLTPRVVDKLPSKGERVGDIVVNLQDNKIYFWIGDSWKSFAELPISRADISDFWNSPFWANIPDKPSQFPPEPHKTTHATGGSDELTPADIGAAPDVHTHTRADITDLLPITDADLGFGFGWEHVATINVTSAVQSVSFTGLNGDTDKVYLLIGVILNADSANARWFFVRFNGDTAIGNYAYLYWVNEAGTVSSGSQSIGATTGTAGITLMRTGANGIGMFVAYIHALGVPDSVGQPYVTVISNGHGSGSPQRSSNSGHWKKSANVTQIDVFQSAGAYIGAGSKIMLFKLANV